MSIATPLEGAKNVSLALQGKVLSIYCDLSKEFGASSSGKTVVIASSSGNKPLGKSGAFLGLNLFTKSLENRDITAKGTAALRKDAFDDVGDGCAWRIEADGVTLCVRIDLAAVKERPASSGKSVLLATTSGNKAVGGTGILCGLNCYRPTDGPLDLSKLAEEAIPTVQVGGQCELGDGYTLHYPSATEVCVTLDGELDAGGATTNLPTCRIGDVTLTAYVGAPKAKRARKEEVKAEGDDGGACSVAVGGFMGDMEKSKVRNLTATCTARDGRVRLQLTFDPSQCLGRTTSGKSLVVASSGGFQLVSAGGEAAVCRVSFNAYKPAPPLTGAEIDAAVAAVLARKAPDELLGLSFKAVLAEVMVALGLAEGQEDLVKEKVKTAVKEYVSHTSQSQ